MQSDFESKNDIKTIISKFTTVAHDWDADLQTLRCIKLQLTFTFDVFRDVMAGLVPQKTETSAFDELSAAISHLQYEMGNLRQVKPVGILARIKQESSDLEMIDDSKENIKEMSVSTPKYKHINECNSFVH